MSQFFVLSGKEKRGPFSFHEIETKYNDGEFSSQDFVSKVDSHERMLMGEFLISFKAKLNVQKMHVSKPVLKRPTLRLVDTSATMTLEVQPPPATILRMTVVGEARVGNDIEVLVTAELEGGDRDEEFNEKVNLICDRPIQGLKPLEFYRGEARLTLTCLSEGAHHLSLNWSESEALEQSPISFAKSKIAV